MNTGLRAVAEDLNATFIAAQSAQKEWNVPGAPADYVANATTELKYFDDLQSDTQTRFGVSKLRHIPGCDAIKLLKHTDQSDALSWEIRYHRANRRPTDL